VLSTQVRCLNSAFLLLDHADDLFFAKPTLLQLSSPSAATSAAWVSLDYAGPIFGVKVKSTTDADALLARKGNGKEAKLSYNGNLLTENRNGLIVCGPCLCGP